MFIRQKTVFETLIRNVEHEAEAAGMWTAETVPADGPRPANNVLLDVGGYFYLRILVVRNVIEIRCEMHEGNWDRSRTKDWMARADLIAQRGLARTARDLLGIVHRGC